MTKHTRPNARTIAARERHQQSLQQLLDGVTPIVEFIDEVHHYIEQTAELCFETKLTNPNQEHLIHNERFNVQKERIVYDLRNKQIWYPDRGQVVSYGVE